MAKRFTDSEKWNKPWFRKLPLKLKAVWNYLCDNCDHAGIWPGDFSLMSFQLGAKVSREEVVKFFKGKVTVLPSGKIFIPSFIDFQYGELNPGNNAHRSVIQILKKEGIGLNKGAPAQPLPSPCPAPHEDLMSPCPGAQDKEMDKEMDMDLDKEMDKEPPEDFSAAFDALWLRYPNRIKKTDARHRFERMIDTSAQVVEIQTALDQFLAYHRARKTEAQYIPHFTTFLGTDDKPRWRDWLDVSLAAGGVAGYVPIQKSQDDLEFEKEIEETRRQLEA